MNEELRSSQTKEPPFRKVLIANRGDVALRIMRACHEMGIETVAVHSTADEHGMHVRLADEAVCIGPPAPKDSYLNKAAILTAANMTGCDAIHPGIGFLSENDEFARWVEAHGFTWIGPKPELISVMGDKVAAKQAAREAGIPCVPGSAGALTSLEDAYACADEVGYPVIVKASAGGGGRGMKIADTRDDLKSAYELAGKEAGAAFGNDELYLEKYLGDPRHIEIQVIGDKHGNVAHLGERDCSVQRRHQKVIEEAPSPGLTPEQRERIGRVTQEAVAKLGYDSAGTVEYLFENGEFYFIEMNTRLQVEHPITEMITGVDLVAMQIRVAAGEKLDLPDRPLLPRGHAIECRINAEHPETFMPSPGKIDAYHAPGGMGVRIDSQIYSGYRIPPYYDSLVAKLIVHAKTREECIAKLRRSLREYVIEGIETTLPLHARLIEEPDFQSGDYTIKWLERLLEADT